MMVARARTVKNIPDRWRSITEQFLVDAYVRNSPATAILNLKRNLAELQAEESTVSLDTHICDLPFRGAAKIGEALQRHLSVDTIGDLFEFSAEELLECSGIAEGTVQQLSNFLAGAGYTWPLDKTGDPGQQVPASRKITEHPYLAFQVGGILIDIAGGSIKVEHPADTIVIRRHGGKMNAENESAPGV